MEGTTPTTSSSQSTTPAQAPSTSSYAGLDTSLLRQYASRSLTDVLDSLAGPKILIIDPAIAGPLGLVTDVSNLKHHGVDKLFWLEPGPLGAAAASVRNVVWVCKQNVKAMKIIAEQVLAASTASNTPSIGVGGSGSRTYTLLIAPRLSHLCTSALSDAGVLGSLDVRPFEVGFIPIERDLLSLEEDFGGYDRIFKDGDFGPVYHMASSLMMLQRAFGLIPRIMGKGDSAQRLAGLLKRMRQEMPAPPPGGPAARTPASQRPLEPESIDSLVIIDRQVDMVTPMCTQLTYEGLLDEIIGIKNAHVEVSPDLMAPSTPVAGTTAHSVPSSSTATPTLPKKKKQLLSSASDGLFAELRDKNFALVGATLNRVAKRISGDYEKRNEAKTPAQIREFVGRLGNLQSEHQGLRLHTGLSEQVLATTSTDEFNAALEVQQNLVAGIDLSIQEAAILNLINQEAPLRTVLRLLCLYSLVSGGVKPKRYDEIRREVLHTYGHSYLALLVSLSTLSLFSPVNPSVASSSGSSGFAGARRPLRLIVDDVDEHQPNDVSYVYSGYAPLSVRVVQCALAGKGGAVTGWRGLADEVIRTIHGATFEEVQKPDEGASRSVPTTTQAPPTTVVCFLGGVTYAEVSALRFAASQTRGRRILIVTTGMVSGNTILDGLMPPALRSRAAS